MQFTRCCYIAAVSVPRKPNLVWCLVKPLMAGLLFGAAGPALVVCGLVLDDPGPSLVIGIIVTSIIVVIATIYGLLKYSRLRDLHALHTSGGRVTATVSKMVDTGVESHDEPVVRMTVEYPDVDPGPTVKRSVLVRVPLAYAGAIRGRVVLWVGSAADPVDVDWQETQAVNGITSPGV